MLTKKELKLLTEVLNIEGVRVSYKQQHEGIGIILKVDSIAKESACNICGTRSDRLHQNHQQIIKDLDWGEQAVFLEINRRQFNCEKCQKPFSEELEFVKARRRYTKRLANQTIKEVLADDIRSVAKKGKELIRIISQSIDRSILNF